MAPSCGDVPEKGMVNRIARRMKNGRSGLVIGLTIGMIAALITVCALPTFAQPTANWFGVEDASGYKNTYVAVPVNITNVQSGPVISILFDLAYDKSIINVMDVQKGTLTSFWDAPAFNNNFSWGIRVSLLYDGERAHALQNGSTGSVALLNFSILGEGGETSMMKLSNIQLAGPPNYQVGTAPSKNGTFTIRSNSNSSVNDTVEDVTASKAYWDEDGLWHVTERRSKSASHSWWYGLEATGTYDTGAPNSGRLVSKAIDLTDATNATLKFWTYWQTENTDTKWDKKLVEISTDGGATWKLLQQLSGSMQGDRALSLLEYVGNEVMIQFRFDTVDKYYNQYEGWFIDDITVVKQTPDLEILYVNKSGWWREGGAFNLSGTPIQAAIESARSSNSTTIHVAAGTYHEQVTIEDKSLTLIGAGNGADPTSNSIIKPIALTKSPIRADPDSDTYWDYILAAYTTDYLGTQKEVKITGFRLDANGLTRNKGTHFAGVFMRDISGVRVGDAGLVGCTVTNVSTARGHYCMYLGGQCTITIADETFH